MAMPFVLYVLFALMQKEPKKSSAAADRRAGQANAHEQSLYFIKPSFIELIG
jgi:hypothetical protein